MRDNGKCREKKILNIAYLQSEVQKMNISMRDAYLHGYMEFVGV